MYYTGSQWTKYHITMYDDDDDDDDEDDDDDDDNDNNFQMKFQQALW